MADETPERGDDAPRDDFFVGYLGRLPAIGRGLVLAAMIGLVGGFLGGAYAVSVSQPNPGDGAILWGSKAETRGVFVARPYPHVREAPTEAHPQGRTIPVVRIGKRGVIDLAEKHDGQVVEIRGVWTQRGAIQMLQLNNARNFKVLADAPTPRLTPAADLGRWRLTGEICDGKCYLGAMRPGRGLAHKACANLCILGGAPAVFVSAGPVEGTEFLMLAGPDGAAPPAAIFDLVAQMIEVEGRIERHGDLLIFKMDPATVKRL